MVSVNIVGDNSTDLCFPSIIVVVIGFEETMYNTPENNSVSVTVCASVRPPPSLAKTVEVNLASADGTAMGKP